MSVSRPGARVVCGLRGVRDQIVLLGSLVETCTIRGVALCVTGLCEFVVARRRVVLWCRVWLLVVVVSRCVFFSFGECGGWAVRGLALVIRCLGA